MQEKFVLHRGDCLSVLRTLPDNSVDSVITDPPYGLSREPDMAEVLRHWLAGDDYQHKGGGFMGKSWDSFVPGPSVWRECLRVLKPGGHLLSFFGSRTYDMGAIAIRLAGFEVRDQIMWLYGSGFPKNHDVSKAIDKMLGADREVVGQKHVGCGNRRGDGFRHDGSTDGVPVTAPTTDEAMRWDGWGTALKPAHEPIVVARKPLAGTAAQNVLAHGTGALNIDGCRVAPTGERLGGGDESGKSSKPEGWARPWMNDPEHVAAHNSKVTANVEKATELGRWPANLIHDGSDEVLAAFPQAKGQQGQITGSEPSSKTKQVYGQFGGRPATSPRGDTGSAARFFYCAKASRRDRNEGCEAIPERTMHWSSGDANPGSFQSAGTKKAANNNHPTVKPTDLMRYLCRLVTPPGGVVLDPYTGSGSTGKGAVLEGFKFIGIERDEDESGQPLGYMAIAEARIQWAVDQVYVAANDNSTQQDTPQLSLL